MYFCCSCSFSSANDSIMITSRRDRMSASFGGDSRVKYVNLASTVSVFDQLSDY